MPRRGDPAGRLDADEPGSTNQLTRAGTRRQTRRRTCSARRGECTALCDISYPPELPVTQRRDDIAAAIRDHQVVIVAGETGSGRPPSCRRSASSSGRGSDRPDRAHPAAPDRGPLGRRADRRGARHRAGRPGRLPGPVHRPHLEGQPGQADDRRHPARRAAARPAAAEVRHDHHRRGPRAEPQHRLPARLPQAAAAAAAGPQADHHLARPSTRSGSRSTSPTAREAAPIVEVSGRTYPVEVRYRPLDRAPRGGRGGRGVVRDQTEAIVDAVKELSAEGPGDILVFLPGEREIRDTADALERPADATARTSRSCRSTRGSPPPSSTGSSSPHAGTPGRARHQRRGDLADRARHPVRRRHRRRAHLAVLRAHQGAAAADRADQPGLGQPALRPLRPGRGGHRDPALLRGGLRGPPGVHRPRDPAHQPGQRHPADDLARARRHRPVPVRRAARPAQRHRRRAAARGARRAVSTRRTA